MSKKKNERRKNQPHSTVFGQGFEPTVTPRKLARNVARKMRADDGEKKVNRGISIGWRRTVAPIAGSYPIFIQRPIKKIDTSKLKGSADNMRNDVATLNDAPAYTPVTMESMPSDSEPKTLQEQINKELSNS